MSTQSTASAWFVTGAASGLGYAIAEHALRQGDRVVLTSRSAGELAQ